MRWMFLLILLLLIACEPKSVEISEVNIQEPIEGEVDTPNLFQKEEKLHDGDLIISHGNQTIENAILTIRGNVILNGTGTLVIKNSDLIFDQEFSQQFRFYVQDRSQLVMENVNMDTNEKWFNFQYEGSPRVSFKNVHGWNCCVPWHGSTDNAQFIISNSTIGLTINQNVKVLAQNSSLFFELVLTNVSGTFELPQEYQESYNLFIPNENGVMELHIKNSTFTDWGATLDRHTNVTFLNSKMTIGMNAGSDWMDPNPLVRVSGLKSTTYKDKIIEFDTNKLHLVNTYVRDWYPQAFNQAVVEIRGSDLADLQWNGGDSTIIVYDSISQLAIARQNVTYNIYNSKIMGDVVVHDDAEIYLFDTSVEGTIRELGNGKVFIDGQRFQ